MSSIQTEKLLFKIYAHLQKISNIRSILTLSRWDQAVAMPPGAAKARSQQMAMLSGVLHDLETDPNYINLLHEIDVDKLSNVYDRVNVQLCREKCEKEKRIPKELVQRKAQLTSEGLVVWTRAKKENDFVSFAPLLKQHVEMLREIAKHIDEKKDPMDVWLNEVDRGMTCKRIDGLFKDVKGELIPLIQRIEDAKQRVKIDDSFIKRKFPISIQKKLCTEVAVKLGYSLNEGRLDISAHPFTSRIHRTDVRITTRYKPDDFVRALNSTIHETGHALYNMGLNQQYYGTPVADPLGKSFHESQSLLWQRFVGGSKEFWKFLWPIVLEHFPQIPKNHKYLDAYKAVNIVQPNPIRTESDEVTYPMHIIMRYELEKGLLHGEFQVEDLPQLWNSKMKDYLGITPPNDTMGVLQDVHWSSGKMGHFSSYLCGVMLASQLFNTAQKEIENLKDKISNGEFTELKKWLNENIHQKGSLYSFDELVENITGEQLGSQHLVKYLKEKYSEIYNL